MDPFGSEPDFTGQTAIVDGGVLTVGTLNAGSYGNGFNGQTADDGIVAFQFTSNNGRGLTIEFDAYDVDFAGEILVYLNGQLVGIAADGSNDALSDALVNISNAFVIQGGNELQFVQSDQSDGTWGVTNILMSAEPTLRFGEFEQGIYGNRVGGAIETDGVISFQVFHDTTEDLTLYVQGYDVDYYGEVEVFLNGTSLGYMTAGDSNAWTGSKFDIAAASLLDGSNEVSFEIVGSHARAWGVTDLILLNAGTNVSTMELDPEFSEDGWVTWMNINSIFLGRYDTNSGALIEVVNVSEIAPLPFLQTYYGSELILTTEGWAGIGIAAEGLIYVGETETYLLEGTEGFRVGFLPKGELETLRFTMVDLDYFITEEGPVEVFLYDDGVISLIDFGDPTVRAVTWLNQAEVVVFSATEVGVYDIETEDLVWFAPNIYEEGYTAALEAQNGESYIVVQSGEYIDIFTKTATGWELLNRVQPPAEVFGIYLYSPELFEWQGRVFLMGISSELPTTQADTAVVLYDIENDAWSQINDVGQYFDPEVFVLEDGSVALYYRDKTTSTTDWFTISYEEVLARAVPGADPVPAARIDSVLQKWPNSSFARAGIEPAALSSAPSALVDSLAQPPEHTPPADPLAAPLVTVARTWFWQDRIADWRGLSTTPALPDLDDGPYDGPYAGPDHFDFIPFSDAGHEAHKPISG